jgi:ankyrin repeat protein
MDRVGNWQPNPGPETETAAPPNSLRRPGEAEGAAILEAMHKLPAHCMLPDRPRDVRRKAYEAWLARDFHTVEVLVQLGAKIEQDWLIEACREADVDAIKFLIRCGADANRPDLFLRSPLIYAVIWAGDYNGVEAQLAVIRALLEGGADVNLIRNRKTAIQYAFKVLNPHVVRLLLDHGAALPPIGHWEAVVLTKCADLCAGNEKLGEIIHEALERYLENLGDGDPLPDAVVRYVAQYNARDAISEMDPEGWARSPGSVPFVLRRDGLDAIKLASAMAFDPDVPMKHVLTILNFVKHEALGAPKPVRDALLNAVNELFVQLKESVIAELTDRGWELVHQFLAKAPFRM